MADRSISNIKRALATPSDELRTIETEFIPYTGDVAATFSRVLAYYTSMRNLVTDQYEYLYHTTHTPDGAEHITKQPANEMDPRVGPRPTTIRRLVASDTDGTGFVLNLYTESEPDGVSGTTPQQPTDTHTHVLEHIFKLNATTVVRLIIINDSEYKFILTGYGIDSTTLGTFLRDVYSVITVILDTRLVYSREEYEYVTNNLKHLMRGFSEDAQPRPLKWSDLRGDRLLGGKVGVALYPSGESVTIYIDAIGLWCIGITTSLLVRLPSNRLPSLLFGIRATITTEEVVKRIRWSLGVVDASIVGGQNIRTSNHKDRLNSASKLIKTLIPNGGTDDYRVRVAKFGVINTASDFYSEMRINKNPEGFLFVSIGTPATSVLWRPANSMTIRFALGPDRELQTRTNGSGEGVLTTYGHLLTNNDTVFSHPPGTIIEAVPISPEQYTMVRVRTDLRTTDADTAEVASAVVTAHQKAIPLPTLQGYDMGLFDDAYNHAKERALIASGSDSVLVIDDTSDYLNTTNRYGAIAVFTHISNLIDVVRSHLKLGGVLSFVLLDASRVKPHTFSDGTTLDVSGEVATLSRPTTGLNLSSSFTISELRVQGVSLEGVHYLDEGPLFTADDVALGRTIIVGTARISRAPKPLTSTNTNEEDTPVLPPIDLSNDPSLNVVEVPVTGFNNTNDLEPLISTHPDDYTELAPSKEPLVFRIATRLGPFGGFYDAILKAFYPPYASGDLEVRKSLSNTLALAYGPPSASGASSVSRSLGMGCVLVTFRNETLVPVFPIGDYSRYILIAELPYKGSINYELLATYSQSLQIYYTLFSDDNDIIDTLRNTAPIGFNRQQSYEITSKANQRAFKTSPVGEVQGAPLEQPADITDALLELEHANQDDVHRISSLIFPSIASETEQVDNIARGLSEYHHDASTPVMVYSKSPQDIHKLIKDDTVGQGGTLAVGLDDLNAYYAWSVVYVLTALFESVSIIKPDNADPRSARVYIVALNRVDKTSHSFKGALSLLASGKVGSLTPINWLTSDKSFYTDMTNAMMALGEMRLSALRELIRYVR